MPNQTSNIELSNSVLRQIRYDSETIKNDSMGKLKSILRDEGSDIRKYDPFVLAISAEKWGKQLPNGNRFDASSSLALYELSTFIDQRIIEQVVEKSYLRSNFRNFPSERIFNEFTGIPATDTNYMPIQLQSTGFETTTGNKSSKIKQYTNPSEIKFIKAAISPLRRDVLTFKEGFELSIEDIELAAARQLPLQDSLFKRVSRNLMMQEQEHAFDYNPPGAIAETKGLLFNNKISSLIKWESGGVLNPLTKGNDIVNEFVRIKGEILKATTSVYDAEQMPLCVLVSNQVENAFTRTYSDLNGTSILPLLTELGFRIKGIPKMESNNTFFYYNDPENIELSTSRLVEAQPQFYNGMTTSWMFPFRTITAGVTVKRYDSIYAVNGIVTPVP